MRTFASSSRVLPTEIGEKGSYTMQTYSFRSSENSKAGFSVKNMKKVHVGPNDVRSESQLGPAPVSGRVQKLGI